LQQDRQWKYLYRALDSQGNTIDFYLSSTRNTQAAKRFLSKALRRFKDWEKPRSINTDKAPAYTTAIKELKEAGICPPDVEHKQVKHLNNIIEADHGKLKRLIKPSLGFKSMKTAYATIKGFELMRMFKKGQLKPWTYGQGLMGEVRLIERQFGIYAS
jgi:IS6 family transposase